MARCRRGVDRIRGHCRSGRCRADRRAGALPAAADQSGSRPGRPRHHRRSTAPAATPPRRASPSAQSAPPVAATEQKTPERIDTGGLPAVGDDATIPRDAPKRPIADVQLPEPRPSVEPEPKSRPNSNRRHRSRPKRPKSPERADRPIDTIAPTEGRLERLRGRLAKSQNTLGRSMLGLLGGGDLDEDSWEEVEDTLLIADLGPVATESVVTALRSAMASSSVRTRGRRPNGAARGLDLRAASRPRPVHQGAAA